MAYNTRQKELIRQLIISINRDFSAKEIFCKLTAAGEEVGQTTVYRIIDSMVEDGQLKKTLGEDNEVRYQYLESCDHFGHCYLKCNNCGRLQHIDCEDICDLTAHIERQHKFKVDDTNMVINGLCRSCA